MRFRAFTAIALAPLLSTAIVGVFGIVAHWIGSSWNVGVYTAAAAITAVVAWALPPAPPGAAERLRRCESRARGVEPNRIAFGRRRTRRDSAAASSPRTSPPDPGRAAPTTPSGSPPLPAPSPRRRRRPARKRASRSTSRASTTSWGTGPGLHDAADRAGPRRPGRRRSREHLVGHDDRGRPIRGDVRGTGRSGDRPVRRPQGEHPHRAVRGYRCDDGVRSAARRGSGRSGAHSPPLDRRCTS